MRIEFWRMRIYSAGFLVAFALHLALNGIERPPALLVFLVVVIVFGAWKRSGPWLRAGVMLGILHALAFPVLQQAAANGESIATVVMRVPVWPQLLVTLIGSRVLATEGKLSFIQFWRHPTGRKAAVEIQSIPSAIALGSFLTLLFYVVTPYASTSSARQTTDMIVSALLGGTVVQIATVPRKCVRSDWIQNVALNAIAVTWFAGSRSGTREFSAAQYFGNNRHLGQYFFVAHFHSHHDARRTGTPGCPLGSQPCGRR
jgi:hypothetical protein